MVVDISTPPQQRRPLRAIQHVTKEDGRSDEEMLLRWGRPNVVSVLFINLNVVTA